MKWIPTVPVLEREKEYDLADRMHVVHFYGTDAELTSQLGGYFAGTLRSGRAAIVVATPAHRATIRTEIARLGVDISTAEEQGRYLALDAEDLMSRFLVGNRLDPSMFRATVGELIEHSGRGGRHVEVFGEMVSLLCDDGQLNAALELESLWNELGEELSFSLVCSYPSASVVGEDRRAFFEEICQLHSDVVGEGSQHELPTMHRASHRAVVEFAADAKSPRAARHFVVQTLGEWGHGELVHDAALVATELCTNAVLHARSAFSVALTCLELSGSVSLRIEVRDHTPLAPRSQGAPFEVAPDHGLGVVSALADEWAIEPLPDGKLTWAKIRGGASDD